VAGLMGNSPAILKKHYVGVVRREMNDDFWSLTPTTVPHAVLTLPKGGKGIKAGKLIPDNVLKFPAGTVPVESEGDMDDLDGLEGLEA